MVCKNCEKLKTTYANLLYTFQDCESHLQCEVNTSRARCRENEKLKRRVAELEAIAKAYREEVYKKNKKK